jgi:hypothetical protein
LPALDLDFGFFSAGVGVVRLNGQRGIVLANGLDFGPQPVTMHVTRQGSPAGSTTDWISTDSDYNSGVCVADLDDDHKEDVVVTVLGSRFGKCDQGGVKVYRGTGNAEAAKSLRTEPEWLLEHAGVAGCAAEDVDGDGIKDLVVATLVDSSPDAADVGPHVFHATRPGFHGLGILNTLFHGSVRVLYDPMKHVGPARVWAPTPPAADSGTPPPGALRFASAVKVADVDGDSTPDVVVAGSRVAVYYAKHGDKGGNVLPSRPDWISSDEYPYAPSVDVVTLPPLEGQSPRTIVVATRSCACMACCAGNKTGTFAYLPKGGPTDATGSGTSIWSITYDLGDRIAGPSTVLDVDDDGLPDVLTSVFAGAGGYGGNLEIIRGVRASRPFQDAPTAVLQQVRLGDPTYQTVVGGFLTIESDSARCRDLIVSSSSPLAPSMMFLNNCSHPGD